MQEETTRPQAGEEFERALRESEERYRAFIANSSEGIWRFELEEPVRTDLHEDEQIELYYQRGYLAECNDAMARMYGFARAEEITGARLGEFLVREDPNNVEYLRAFIRSGYRLADAESVETDRDGRLRYFINNLVGAVEGGRLLRAWGTQRDATAMKEAEAEMRRGEERYRSLLENANDIVYSHDLEGKYLAINRAGERITGYTREEILGGLNIAQVVAPEHLALARRMTEEKLRDPSKPTVYTVDIIARDGTRLTIEVSTRIAFDGGRPVAVEGIARDVTERVRAAVERERLLEEARAARDLAEEANRLKDEFLATLSHELRTPLTAILGWASMLRAGGLNADTARRAVESIERNARAQKQLVEDVLDVSRIITGKLRLEMRPVELGALVRDAVETVRPAAEAKGIELRTRLAADAGEVAADPERLQQVLWNLLSNAVKFTPGGGRVEIGLTREGASTVIRVGDTGAGIAPEFLPHVFERFRQADMGTTRQHGGLGLGLAIVRHLVELHGGEVTAESAGIDRGATFTIRLPLKASTPSKGGPEDDD